MGLWECAMDRHPIQGAFSLFINQWTLQHDAKYGIQKHHGRRLTQTGQVNITKKRSAGLSVQLGCICANDRFFLSTDGRKNWCTVACCCSRPHSLSIKAFSLTNLCLAYYFLALEMSCVKIPRDQHFLKYTKHCFCANIHATLKVNEITLFLYSG